MIQAIVSLCGVWQRKKQKLTYNGTKLLDYSKTMSYVWDKCSSGCSKAHGAPSLKACKTCIFVLFVLYS